MGIDYEYLAASLSSLAGLPVRLYRDGEFAGLYHHTKFKPDLAILEEEHIFANPGNVSYYMDENFLYYGLFRAERRAVALIIGPVAHSPVNHTLAVRILRAMGVTDSGFLKMMAKEGLRYGVYSGLAALVMYLAVQKILYYFMVHVYRYLHPQGFISLWILPVLVLVNIILCTAVTLFSAGGILRRQIIGEIRE